MANASTNSAWGILLKDCPYSKAYELRAGDKIGRGMIWRHICSATADGITSLGCYGYGFEGIQAA